MFSLAGGYLEDRVDLVDLRIRGVLIGVVHRGDRRAGPEQSGELILIRADVVIDADVVNAGGENNVQHIDAFLIARVLADQRLVIVSGREQLFTLIGEFLQNNAGTLKVL